MTRQEILHAMQERHILMTTGLMNAIGKMSDQELAARWAGIQKLAEIHRPGNKPGWMGRNFCNPTTLYIGQKELERIASEETQRLTYAQKKQEEAAAEAWLSKAKMIFWNRCTTKRKLIEKNLVQMDECFQEMIRKKFLDCNNNLDALPEKQALLWFWFLIPPFKAARAPPVKIYIPLEKASWPASVSSATDSPIFFI